jgi:hypothetical protein
MCGQMIMTMLAEIVLCVKEVNSKTRAAAFEVLLDLAHAMENADPASAVPDDDIDMGNRYVCLSYRAHGTHMALTHAGSCLGQPFVDSHVVAMN